MKTRILLMIILVSISSSFLYPQGIQTKPGSLRIESGYAFTGSGDLEGYCFYNEFSCQVGGRFKIAPAIGFLSFFRDDQYVIDNLMVMNNASAISLDLTGYYYPVSTPKFDIEAGLGLYLRNWHWIYATGPDQMMSTSGVSVGPGSYYDEYTTAPGFGVSIGTLLKLSSRLGISIRGVYQNDRNNDNSVTARFGLNIGL